MYVQGVSSTIRGDGDVGDFDVGEIFWVLVLYANVKWMPLDGGYQNGQNRHQNISSPTSIIKIDPDIPWMSHST